MPDADDLSATLAGIRENNERVIALCGMAPAIVRQLAEVDVPRLLAAFDTVLALAGEWDRVAAGSLHEIDEMLPECARALREAITTVLTGKDGRDAAT